MSSFTDTTPHESRLINRHLTGVENTSEDVVRVRRHGVDGQKRLQDTADELKLNASKERFIEVLCY